MADVAKVRQMAEELGRRLHGADVLMQLLIDEVRILEATWPSPRLAKPTANAGIPSVVQMSGLDPADPRLVSARPATASVFAPGTSGSFTELDAWAESHGTHVPFGESD